MKSRSKTNSLPGEEERASKIISPNSSLREVNRLDSQLSVLSRRLTRRQAMGTAGRVAIGAAAVIVAAGGTAAYFAAQPSKTSTTTQTVTQTQSQVLTQTQSVTQTQSQTVTQTVTQTPTLMTSTQASTASNVAAIAAAIQSEGAQLTIAGWEFNGLGQTAFAPGFAAYVKQTYGVDVNVTWVPFASVGDVIPKLQVLQQADKPLSDAGYDAVTGEYSWYSQFEAQGFLEPYVTSAVSQSEEQQLMPRLADVPSQWQGNDRVQFQAFAWLQPIINGDQIDTTNFKDWNNYADPVFKGKLVVRSLSLYSGRLPFIGLIKSLGMDPWNDNSWISMMKWFKQNVQPNVFTYFTGWGDMYKMMQSGEAGASFNGWDSHFRQLSSQGVNLVDILPASGCPSDPGNLFIIKGTPHPVLSRIWINWMLGPDFQFAGYYRPTPTSPVINVYGLDLPSVLYTCEKDVDVKDSDLLPPALAPYYPTDQQLLQYQLPVNTQYFTLDKQNWIYQQWQQIVGTQ